MSYKYFILDTLVNEHQLDLGKLVSVADVITLIV